MATAADRPPAGAAPIPKDIRDKIQLGDFAAALPLLEAFVTASPQNGSYMVYSMLANCALQSKEISKAARALEAALALSPPKENIQKIWKVLKYVSCQHFDHRNKIHAVVTGGLLRRTDELD
jgi:tetratricopeptide (TPR) repeat protein